MSILRAIKTNITNTGIRTKLLTAFLIMVMVPLLTLTLLTYKKVSGTMEDNMLHSSTNAVNQSVTYLESKLSSALNALDIIYFNQTLQSVVSSKEDIYENDIVQQSVDQKNLYNLIEQLERNPDIFLIRLYIRSIGGYYYDKTNFNVYDNLASVPWFKRLEALPSVINILPPQYFASEGNNDVGVISVFRRMNIKKYDKTDALIRIDIRESVVDDIVRQANNTKTGLTYIVNQSGEIVSFAGNQRLLENPTLRELVEKNARDGGGSRNIFDGKDFYIIIEKSVQHSDWTFFTVIPYNEIKSTGESIRFYMSVIMLVTIVFTFIIAYFISNSSTRRLRYLADNMKKVTGGDFSVHIKESSHDEIGQLMHDFNFMVHEMSDMIRERYETGKQIKSMELMSLRSQINPHFLYNSLDMINWSASMSGNEEIVEMVQSLSKFYKIGLSKGQDIISIKNELEHVKAYVSIQNLRYNNQINLITEVDTDLENCGILKITLQPIVENAILHGILKKRDKSGTIKISVTRRSDTILVKIQDDGTGMPGDAVEKLLSEESRDEFHGYGIKNINERIKLQFGSQYGIQFESSPGIGTTAIITLPVIPL